MTDKISPAELARAFADVGDDMARRVEIFPLLPRGEYWLVEKQVHGQREVVTMDWPDGRGDIAVGAFIQPEAAARWADGKGSPTYRTFDELCATIVTTKAVGALISGLEGRAFLLGLMEAIYMLHGFMPGVLLPGMGNPEPVIPEKWSATVRAPDASAAYLAERAASVLGDLPAVEACYLALVSLDGRLPFLVLASQFRPGTSQEEESAAVNAVADTIGEWPKHNDMYIPVFSWSPAEELWVGIRAKVKPFYTAPAT